MAYETLHVEIRERIAFVTINRPDKLNALNAKAKSELGSVLEGLRSDRSVDVVIITGSGDKAFVAGTDIKELTALDAVLGKTFAADGQAVFAEIENLGKPVIAAVNGYALGGGCELALACHIRIASDKARFGQPEVNLGIIPGYGGTQRLARLIGKGRACEMIVTGEPIDAAEALRIGLVNKVVPHAELMAAAEKMALAIITKGQLAVRFALQAVMLADETMLSDGLGLEADLFGQCCATNDFKEGTAAFLEKRKPQFTHS